MKSSDIRTDHSTRGTIEESVVSSGGSDWRKNKRRNEGSIRANKNGTYLARVQYLDENGKRREIARKVKNKTAARAVIKEIKAKISDLGSSAIDAERLTFADLADRFSRTNLVPAVYESGRKIYGMKSLAPAKSALKALVDFFGRKLVKEIRHSDLEVYRKLRLESPVAIVKKLKVPIENAGRKKYNIEKMVEQRPRKIASVNRELQLLRTVFRFAVRDKLVSSSPFDNHSVIAVAAEVERERILSYDEEIRLLAACSGARNHLRPIVIIALDTAMRRGEILKLKWNDVNLEEGTIRILATNTKTEKQRFVGMTSRLRNELQKLWDDSPRIKDELVFGIKDNFKLAWKTACKMAKITDLRFHDLRHTATTRLVADAKVGVSEAMKITGHTQLKTFQRYMNLSSEGVISAARSLDSYLLERAK